MFFFNFFLFANCKNTNCIINIGDRYVDLSNLKIANNNYHYVHPTEGNFSFRLCGDLIENDPLVPSCGLSEKGWSGAANGFDAQGNVQCYQTAATDSFTSKKISDTQFTIEYGSDTDSEPASVDEVHTIYDFNYVKQQSSEDPISVDVSDIAKNRVIVLTFKINFEYLPNKPTPSPLPDFNPEFVKESQTKSGMGIRFNLSEFVSFQQTILTDGENIEVDFSPGRFIDCPYPYNCRHYTPSSLYLCRAGKSVTAKSQLKAIHEEKGYCSSFGIASSTTTFDQTGLSEGDGIYINYRSNDPSKTAKVFLKCDDDVDPHVLKLGSKLSGDDKSISFTMRTSDTCIRSVTPVPDPVREYCRHSLTVHGTDLVVDLREISRESGYKVDNVRITDEKTGQLIADDASFLIHPCGVLGCPTGFSCPASNTNDDVTSSFWKCLSSTRTCESIGRITSSDVAFDADDSVDGVIVRFGSSLFGNKNATIQYVCQEDAKTPILESNATYDSTNSVYKVRIRQKLFCTSSAIKKKSLSGGAIFLILLAIIVFLYAGVGTIVLSIMKAEFTFPNQSFWIEFGLCIKEACTHICSCSKISDNLMKSTYDKI